MLSVITKSVSTLCGSLEPAITLDIASLIPKIKKYLEENESIIEQIYSDKGNYTKPNSKLIDIKLNEKAFPSQITFVIPNSKSYFKIKVSINSKLQIPGVLLEIEKDIPIALNALLACLSNVLNITFVVKNIIPHMMNYKFKLDKQIDFYKLEKALAHYETGKIRCDLVHIKYLIKKGDISLDSLKLLVR